MAGVDSILYAKLSISNRNQAKISALQNQYSVDYDIPLTSVRHIHVKNNYMLKCLNAHEGTFKHTLISS